MVRIDFSNLKVFKNLARTKEQFVDIKEQVSNDLYQNGQGIAFHSLALKIYNTNGVVELEDKEYDMLMVYAEQMCTPSIIDAFKECKEKPV